MPAALVEVGGGIGSPEMETQKLSQTMLEEIGEELAQDVLEGMSDKMTSNPKLPFLSIKEDAVVNPVNLAKTAAMTVPIVAVGGGANKAVNKIATSYAKRQDIKDLNYKTKKINQIFGGDNALEPLSKRATAQEIQQRGEELQNRRNILLEYINEHKANKVVGEYKNAVDENLANFVQDAKNNTTDNKSVFRLNNVNDRMAEEIKGLTGIDAKNYGNVIKANSIRHIIKEHGVNGETDSSMADDADIARIQYVIDNYDTMELLKDKSKEYRDKNQKPAPMVKISKRVNGTYYVVEAVPDTNRHELAVVTAYKKKATEQQTRDAKSPHSDVRNASTDVAFNDNIEP